MENKNQRHASCTRPIFTGLKSDRVVVGFFFLAVMEEIQRCEHYSEYYVETLTSPLSDVHRKEFTLGMLFPLFNYW